MTKSTLSRRAFSDLNKIWQYTFEYWGVDQADKYVRGLKAAIDSLGENSKLGHECDYIREGYRKHYCGSHVIFFRISSNNVKIIRILHQKMDIGLHL